MVPTTQSCVRIRTEPEEQSRSSKVLKKTVESTYFALARGEHWEDGKAHGTNAEGRSPVIAQNGQADMAVGVDVRVLGNVWRDEQYWTQLKTIKTTIACVKLKNKRILPGHTLRGVKRIFRGKNKFQSKMLVGIDRTGSSIKFYRPPNKNKQPKQLQM